MLDHISIYVNDYEKAKSFYTAALAPLGYSLVREFAEWSVMGFGAGGKPDFWVSQREAIHNVHIALAAQDTDVVNAFYDAALQAGAADNGAPGYRSEYSPGYYGAFVIDPFGNNLEAVFHDPSPPAGTVTSS